VTDNKKPILKESNKNSNKLYILFGGIAAAMGMPPFEFYNWAQILSSPIVNFHSKKYVLK